MKSFRNILCVVAAEAACRPILERAVSLAENNQAQLTVASAIPPDAADRGTLDEQSACADTLATLRAERRQLLESFLEPYQHRLSIHPEVLIGTGFLEIIRAVLRHRFDLVMKPAENPSLIERLFGNDDMHLLRRCPCPVWLTKPGEIANYRCILAAIDFDLERPDAGESHLNRQILDLATSLALSDFAELHVVHVWDTIGEITVRSWSDDPQIDSSSYAESQRQRHQQRLDQVRDQLRAQLGAEACDYLAPRFHLPQGEASKVIPATAHQLQADLVVMGTVGRTGIAGWLIGNTAETILEQLRCSVLAIKPPGFASDVTVNG